MSGPRTAPAVGLLTPYFAFFEERFPAGYRASLQAYADRLAADLAAEGVPVTPSGLVYSAESADAAAERFSAAGVRVVVVAATMAAAPGWGSRALAGFDGPIVIWDDRRIARLDEEADEVEATRASSILGSVMLANVLGREGRTYLTVSTDAGDARPVARAIRGAQAAAGIRGARLGLLGGIIPGYGDVVLDPGTAAALGIELVSVGEAAVARANAAIAGPLPALPAGVTVEPAAAPLLERSLRVHRYLRTIVTDERLDALALNCHSPLLRTGDELGVVGCLATTLLTGEGTPIACTGDAATAVALLVASRIAGSAQYCEGYLVESATGELVLSSCGMADLSLRPDGVPARLCPNELYPGRHGLGIAARFPFAAGPATIVGFGPATPTLPARLVISVGDLSGRGFAHLNGPSGSIGFDRPGAGSASRAFIDAGPAHHLALVRGDRSEELRAAARFLGVELIEIRA